MTGIAVVTIVASTALTNIANMTAITTSGRLVFFTTDNDIHLISLLNDETKEKAPLRSLYKYISYIRIVRFIQYAVNERYKYTF